MSKPLDHLYDQNVFENGGNVSKSSRDRFPSVSEELVERLFDSGVSKWPDVATSAVESIQEKRWFA